MPSPISIRSLSPGDHACFRFSSDDQLRRFAIAYVSEGLRARQRVLYLWDSEAVRDAVLAAISESDPGVVEAGGLMLAEAESTYRPDGRFDDGRTVELFTTAVHEARLAGYEGLRVCGDMGWAADGSLGRALADYERDAEQVFEPGGALAVCAYDERRFDRAAISAAAGVHPLWVEDIDHTRIRDNGARFEVTDRPPGMRISGELDLANVEALSAALDLLGGAPAPDTYLDLADLHFIDAAATRLIARAARRSERRTLVLLHPRPGVRRVLELLGCDRLPNIEVVEAKGRRT